MSKNRRISHSWQSSTWKGSLLLGIGVAFLISLSLHYLFLVQSHHWYIASFDPVSFDAFVPRKWSLKRVDIDPSLLQEKERVADASVAHNDTIRHDLEKILQENPQNSSWEQKKDLDSLPSQEKESDILLHQELQENPPKDLSSLVDNSLNNPKRPTFSLDDFNSESSQDTTSKIKYIANQHPIDQEGENRLDQLLQQKELLTKETAPILLPTDLLFTYDSDQLLPEAQKSLEKLALLIEKNPQAHFLIEGFTDSFGSDVYNQKLSQRRANAMKEWLLKYYSIDSSHIQSQGRGKSHYLASPNGSIEEQRLNRRVEIIIE